MKSEERELYLRENSVLTNKRYADMENYHNTQY
jgi:hypothetical protein